MKARAIRTFRCICTAQCRIKKITVYCFKDMDELEILENHQSRYTTQKLETREKRHVWLGRHHATELAHSTHCDMKEDASIHRARVPMPAFWTFGIAELQALPRRYCIHLESHSVGHEMHVSLIFDLSTPKFNTHIPPPYTHIMTVMSGRFCSTVCVHRVHIK